MTKLEQEYIQNLISDFIKNNNKEIESFMISGFDDLMKIEEIAPKMIMRSVSLSSRIAVQLVMEILAQAGVVAVDEELLKKISLKVVK